jgi:hypothetical protein
MPGVVKLAIDTTHKEIHSTISLEMEDEEIHFEEIKPNSYI